MSYNIAIVGATGNVGMEMMNILAEREFPVAEVHAIASRRSVGRDVSLAKIATNTGSSRALRVHSTAASCAQ